MGDVCVNAGERESSKGQSEADLDVEVEASAQRHGWTRSYAQSTETGFAATLHASCGLTDESVFK